MAAVTVYSELVAKENKSLNDSIFSPIYLPGSDGIGCHDLSVWNVEFEDSFFTLFHLHQKAL